MLRFDEEGEWYWEDLKSVGILGGAANGLVEVMDEVHQ